MKVLAKTEYQDLYRIVDGVLLVINKFKPIHYGKNKWISLYNPKVKSYNKDCQKQLKVLKEDHYLQYEKITIPKGTILYYDRLVELAYKTEWNYQVKTTGESFSGDFYTVSKLLKNIIEIIEETNRE